jgi:hypothetical protein
LKKISKIKNYNFFLNFEEPSSNPHQKKICPKNNNNNNNNNKRAESLHNEVLKAPCPRLNLKEGKKEGIFNAIVFALFDI